MLILREPVEQITANGLTVMLGHGGALVCFYSPEQTGRQHVRSQISSHWQ